MQCACVHAQLLSCVRLFVTLWNHQAPLSMEFSQQESGMGCRFLLQGVFPAQDQTHVSCIAVRFFTTEPPTMCLHHPKIIHPPTPIPVHGKIIFH